MNTFKHFSNAGKTLPSKIKHQNEIARKTEDILIFRAIFLTLQFSFTFPILSHSTQNITHFRHFLPLPIQFHPFPPFSTFLRFPCQLTTKKTKINEGEVPQYYIEESHEPIISPEDFEEVQAEFTRRKKLGRKYSGSTMFSAKLVCGDCGHFFGSKVWHSTSKYRRVIWQCNNKFKGEHFCSTPHLYEDEIKIRFISAFAAFFQNREMVLETCRMLLEDLSDTSALDTKIEMLTMELNDIGTLIREHIQKNAESVQNQDSYNLRYDELTEQYERKKGLLQKMQQKRIEHQSRIESMASFLRTLEKTNEPIDYFDDSIWRTTIEKVTVFHDGRMVFQFVDGTEIEA